MAGKGDKDRTIDKEAFDTRFDAIRWPLRDAKSKGKVRKVALSRKEAR